MAEVQVLLSRLNTVRAKERNVAVVAGLTRLLVTGIALVALFFLVDWFFALSKPGRMVMLLLMLGVVAYEAFQHIIREAARYLDDDEISLRVEGRHPELNGRLISTIQLSREHPGVYVGSHELIEALEEDTISFTRSMNFTDIISLKTLKKVALVALGVVVVALAFGASKPDFMRALLKRLMLAEEKYPTRTRIKEVRFYPETLKVARGERVAVDAKIEGYHPEIGTIEFWVKASPGDKAQVEMTPTESDRSVYRGVIRQVMEPISFNVKVYDDRSGPHHVKVLSRPSVSSIRVTYRYPEYTGLDERESEVGDVTALAGTEIAVNAITNKRVKSAKLRLRKGDDFEEIVMGVADKPVVDQGGERRLSELTGSFVIEKDGDYAISVVDTDDLANPSPVRYRIDALADTPPRVKVVKPGKDVTVTKFANWPIGFEVRDDYGVASMRLAYRDEKEADSEAKYIEITGFRGGKEVTGEQYFDLTPLSLEIDTVLIYWVEAADHRKVPKPNVGKSRMYRFMVIEADEKRRELYGDVGEAVRNVQSIIKDQTTARDVVRDVINFVRDVIRKGRGN